MKNRLKSRTSSTADIESGDGAAHERLFIALLRELLPWLVVPVLFVTQR
jgi:hypothetical protein